MERNYRIDSLKGFLILLVVLGHVITALDNTNIINHAVMGLIYVFHMPLFILVSGYFTRPADQQDSQKLWKTVARLMVTIVFFHLVWVFLRYSLKGDDPIEILLEFPYGILWYLISLVYWRLMIYYTPRALLQRPVVYIALAFLVSVLCGLTELGKFLSIQRTLNFYPFFLLGYYYKQGAISDKWWKNNTVHLLTVVILLPVIFLLFPKCGYILNGADHYPLTELPQKMLILMCSTAMSLLVFNLMPDVKSLRPIGKDSLFYYLYHYILLIALIEPVVEHFSLPCSLPFILVYCAIIIALLIPLCHVKILQWLTHPTLKKKSRQSSS